MVRPKDTGTDHESITRKGSQRGAVVQPTPSIRGVRRCVGPAKSGCPAFCQNRHGGVISVQALCCQNMGPESPALGPRHACFEPIFDLVRVVFEAAHSRLMGRSAASCRSARPRTIAVHRDGCSPSCFRISRIARARTSGENFFIESLIRPSSQEKRSPPTPARFSSGNALYKPKTASTDVVQL